MIQTKDAKIMANAKKILSHGLSGIDLYFVDKVGIFSYNKGENADREAARLFYNAMRRKLC